MKKYKRTILGALLVALISAPVIYAVANSPTVATFQMHGEYDLATNPPSIVITHADGTVTNLGTGWTNLQNVLNGDVWTINYPSSDCNCNGMPVVLNGYYSLLDRTNVPKCTANLWLRMPPGMSGCAYVFTFDKTTPGALSWQLISTMTCSANGNGQ